MAVLYRKPHYSEARYNEAELYHNIQRSSLKPLGQSKPNFKGNMYTKGKPMFL